MLKKLTLVIPVCKTKNILECVKDGRNFFQLEIKKMTLYNMDAQAKINHKRVQETAETRSMIFFSILQPSSFSSTIFMTVCAEIVWELTVAQKNFSWNRFDRTYECFKSIFPDSKVNHLFSNGQNKMFVHNKFLNLSLISKRFGRKC